jgi:hypothetical protein
MNFQISCVFIISSILFLIIFFTLNYPEILVHDHYIPTLCKITKNEIIPRYCCTRSCSFCGDGYMLPSCHAQISIFNQKNPLECTKQNPFDDTCPNQRNTFTFTFL